mgnify:CR=1 FL=1
MPLSVGIVGLPNVGKSTLFSALTKREVKISPIPFTTIEPNRALISVPDERLKLLSKINPTARTVPVFIEFIDIAGLIKNAHQGEGLGNQFLSHIRECDLLVQVLRFFNKNIENTIGKISPEEEVEIVNLELIMKDLQTIKQAIFKDKEKEILIRIKEALEKGMPIRNLNLNKEEKEIIKGYNFLSEKPIIYLLNSEKNENFNFPFVDLSLNLKEELEMTQLSEKELEELNLKSKLDLLIKKCYNRLDVITFYTVARKKETRGWLLKRGENILKAAKKIHSDFEKKFKKAEVIDWKELINLGSWEKAKEKGQIRIVGKDYQVKDGEVIEIKI